MERRIKTNIMPAWIILVGLALFAVLAVVLTRGTQNAPSSAQIWKDYASQTGGSYRYSPLGFKHEVTLRVQGWSVMLGQASSMEGSEGAASITELFAHADLTGTHQFQLRLDSRAQRLPVVASFGAPDGQVVASGNAALDAAFEIRTTDAALTHNILSQSQVAEALLKIIRPGMAIGFTSDASGKAGLHIQVQDVRVTKPMIDDVNALTGTLLAQLASAGVITAQ